MRRVGFTLIEVLVSIMIFSVVSVAMLTVFTLATRVFRDTEAARIAGDEVITVLSSLDEDLRSMVPTVAEGFLCCGVNADGNVDLAFLIQGPDGSRSMVTWWTDEGGNLRRFTSPPPSLSAPLGTAISFPANAPIAGTGCLYFAIDLDTELHSRGSFAWDTVSEPAGIYATRLYDARNAAKPPPRAIRISVVLSGGNPNAVSFTSAKEVPVGFLSKDIIDTDTEIPTYGLRTLPSYPGALVRIGDLPDKVEWLAYDRFASGRIHVTARAQRRTDANAHTRGTPVRVGRTYTLVRELPR